jgi:succinyl-CoA synthetase alpha subunit
MSIYLNKDSKVIVQGITGGEGTKHTALMLKAGTNVVGGVNARKAGTTVSHVDKDGNAVELPVFASVAEAIEATGADVSIAFVPPAFTKDAMVEAIDTEIPLLVVITEGVPVGDTAEAWAYAKRRATRPASSVRTAPASSRRARRSSASRRRTSPARARSASCRSRAP